MDERGEPIIGDTLLVLLNAHNDKVPFTLPPLDADQQWQRVFDTVRPHERRPHVQGRRPLSACRAIGGRVQDDAAAARAAPRVGRRTGAREPSAPQGQASAFSREARRAAIVQAPVNHVSRQSRIRQRRSRQAASRAVPEAFGAARHHRARPARRSTAAAFRSSARPASRSTSPPTSSRTGTTSLSAMLRDRASSADAGSAIAPAILRRGPARRVARDADDARRARHRRWTARFAVDASRLARVPDRRLGRSVPDLAARSEDQGGRRAGRRARAARRIAARPRARPAARQTAPTPRWLLDAGRRAQRLDAARRARRAGARRRAGRR